MQLLLAACGEAEVVFHMAFDELAHTDQLEAIEWLSDPWCGPNFNSSWRSR